MKNTAPAPTSATRAALLTVREVYGKPLVYPACPASLRLAALCGVRTLSAAHLRHLVAEGYALKIDTSSRLLAEILETL